MTHRVGLKIIMRKCCAEIVTCPQFIELWIKFVLVAFTCKLERQTLTALWKSKARFQFYRPLWYHYYQIKSEPYQSCWIKVSESNSEHFCQGSKVQMNAILVVTRKKLFILFIDEISFVYISINLIFAHREAICTYRHSESCQHCDIYHFFAVCLDNYQLLILFFLAILNNKVAIYEQSRQFL